MKIFIYTLSDPRTNEVRYVGQTNNLKVRLQNHLSKWNLAKKKGSSIWLNELVDLGLKPEMKLYIETTESNADAVEAALIEDFKGQGSNLTNIFVEASVFGPRSRMIKKNFSPRPHTKRIVRVTFPSGEIKEFRGHQETADALGISKNQIWLYSTGKTKNRKKIKIEVIKAPKIMKQKIQAGAYIIKPVIAENIETGDKLFFESLSEAARILGIKVPNISRVLSGERNHVKGHRFTYDKKGPTKKYFKKIKENNTL